VVDLGTHRRGLALAGLAILLVASIAAGFLYNAAAWLRGVQSPEVAADVIIVLAGSFERPMHAGDLYAKGIAPRIIVSVPRVESSIIQLERMGIRYPRPEVISREILLRKGVPAESIEMLAAGAISTADEAKAFASRLQPRPGRVLVVTSPYHVRRAAMAFSDAFGEGTQVTVTATPYETFPDDWWRSQDAARNVLLELAKITLYLAGGRFSPEGAR
jgi:uncharacterized SAM-binding protein YcdF (DUF218 family)